MSQIPNILTLFRLVSPALIVLSALFLMPPYSDWMVVALFVLAAISDYLDGFLARRLNAQSRFGKIFDPIADKVLVATILVLISVRANLNPWIIVPALIILNREIIVSGLRATARGRGFAVSKLAKIKTFVQMAAIALLLIQELFYHYLVMGSYGLSPELVAGLINGEIDDTIGLVWKYKGNWITYYGGIVALWFAALLSIVTAVDYALKAKNEFKWGR